MNAKTLLFFWSLIRLLLLLLVVVVVVVVVVVEIYRTNVVYKGFIDDHTAMFILTYSLTVTYVLFNSELAPPFF